MYLFTLLQNCGNVYISENDVSEVEDKRGMGIGRLYCILWGVGSQCRSRELCGVGMGRS